MIKLKRVYEDYSKQDGYRILIDRLWPRGIKKVDLHFNEWDKELAPSTELRQWFAHKPERWKEFKTKYKKELRRAELSEQVKTLTALAKKSTVTFLFAAKDEEHCNAVVLKEFIESRL